MTRGVRIADSAQTGITANQAPYTRRRIAGSHATCVEALVDGAAIVEAH